MTIRTRVFAPLASLVLIAGSAFAQPAPAAPARPVQPPAPAAPAVPAAPLVKPADLPKGIDVLNKYVEATGGKAAYEKLKNRVATGSFEIVGMGIKGTLKMTQAAPNMSSMIIDIPNMGKMEQGSDGKHAWENNMMSGPRVLTDKEFEEQSSMTEFNSEINPEKFYKSIECVGIEKVGDAECYKVDLVTKTGSKRSAYYDKATGLLTKMVMEMHGQTGDMTSEVTTSDYKDVNGVKISHKAEMRVSIQPQMKQVMTFDKIENNVDLPADTFAPPAEIKALIEKGDKKDAPKTEAPKTDAPKPDAPKKDDAKK